MTLDGDKVNPSGELSGGAPSSSGSMLTQIMSVLDASKNLEIKQDQLNVLKQQLQNLERVGKCLCSTRIHGLLYIWTELLYLTCPHEADLLTLIMSHKLTHQYF